MEEYKYDVYICFSRRDYFDEQGNVIPGNEITKILQALDEAGISYWINKESISLGDGFIEETVRTIESSRIFLFLSTHNSNYNSKWIAREIAYTSELKKCIIPVRIDSSRYSNSILFYIVDLDRIDYYTNPEKGLVEMINAIKEQIKSSRLKEEYECCAPTHTSPPKSRGKTLSNDVEEQFSPDSSQYRQTSPQYLPPKKPGRSILSRVGTVFDAIGTIAGGIVGGIVSGTSYVGKKIKSITDKTNVSYSAMTNNFSKTGTVLSSVFAPAEVRRGMHMLVQVYLHLPEETNNVQTLAQEADMDAKRRDYIPLSIQLKKGDMVDVLFGIYGETLLMSEKKGVIWTGSFTKCTFVFYVSNDLDIEELSCMAMLTVNGVPAGEMRFITKVVEKPRQLNPEILSHKYNKVFISYSHYDESKVRFLHEGLELGAVPHFFDRKYLKAGDVFPEVIKDYINSADLFILCWSENASKSEYVEKESIQALKRAYPQVQPPHAAKLSIYPMSIEPYAELPSDMKKNYHFGKI